MAFAKLEDSLVNAPTLCQQDDNSLIKISPDISSVAVRPAIASEIPNGKHPVKLATSVGFLS